MNIAEGHSVSNTEAQTHGETQRICLVAYSCRISGLYDTGKASKIMERTFKAAIQSCCSNGKRNRPT